MAILLPSFLRRSLVVPQAEPKSRRHGVRPPDYSPFRNAIRWARAVINANQAKKIALRCNKRCRGLDSILIDRVINVPGQVESLQNARD